MNKEIFLTHNRAFQHWDYQIDKLKVAFSDVGYMCRMITPTDMYKEIANNELPYAVIPLIANSSALNSTHLHYIRDLELRGVKHINSITNSMVVDNKMLSHLELKHAGFPVLKTLDLNIDNFQNIKNVISYVNDTIGFPCVIKPVNSHSTIGIHKINDIGHLKEIMSMLSLFALRTFDFASSNINVIIQEYLPTGNEVIRVNVLDGKCLGGLFKVNKTGWRTNPISEGGERHPYELDDKIKELSLSVCRHFKMNFMSLDIFKTDNGYIINELGSMPAIRVFDEMNPNMNVSKLLVEFLLKE